ncbi:MAG: acyltransferase [Gammaproteobacteria bacterium]|nr:acyltransferase [Gammaproteobacteria bacterium]
MDLDEATLGADDQEFKLDERDAVRDVALAMVSQCKRTLDIVSRHLDPPLFDTAEFAEAVRALALASRYSRIRIVVCDPQPLIKRGHRLVELANRLPTFISLRKPGLTHRQFNEAWLLADSTGYLRRRLADLYETTGSFNARREVRNLMQQFDELWEQGEPDPNLRRLHL